MSAVACTTDDLYTQHPELVCPDGSGVSSAGSDTGEFALFERTWADLVSEAGTTVTVSPTAGAVLQWSGDVEVDWSATPEEIFLLPDCAAPAVSARVDIVVTSAEVELEVPGQVWITGDEDATIAAWSVGGATGVPTAWATDVSELSDGQAPQDIAVTLSLHPRNGSGTTPAPGWSVGGVWRDSAGQILDERPLDQGTWAAP